MRSPPPIRSSARGRYSIVQAPRYIGISGGRSQSASNRSSGSGSTLRAGLRSSSSRSSTSQVKNDCSTRSALLIVFGANSSVSSSSVSQSCTYELRPGTGRRGPPELWTRFDAAVQQLNQASASDNLADVVGAYAAVAQTASQLADALQAATRRRSTPRVGGSISAIRARHCQRRVGPGPERCEPRATGQRGARGIGRCAREAS